MTIINQLEDIVAESQYKEIDGIIVDGTTANAILTVYNALGESNKKHFTSQGITRMVDITWKLIS